MNILGMHFHKWEYIYQERTHTIRERQCTDLIEVYQYCKECESMIYGWIPLSECHRKIILEDIIEKDGKLILPEFETIPPKGE